MKFVSDWKQAPRWFSTQAMVLAGIIQAAWATIPPEMQDSIPQEYVAALTSLLMVLGVFGRLLDQSK